MKEIKETLAGRHCFPHGGRGKNPSAITVIEKESLDEVGSNGRARVRSQLGGSARLGTLTELDFPE